MNDTVDDLINEPNENTDDETIEIDYDWDSVAVNKVNIHYERFGKYDKRMFAPPNLQMSYKEAVKCSDNKN